MDNINFERTPISLLVRPLRGCAAAMGRLSLVLVVCLLCSTAAPAQHQRSELAAAMGQIDSSFAFLKRHIEKDAFNQDNILEIDYLIEAAEKAAGLQPPAAARMKGAARQRYLEGYRSALQALVADATKLRAMVKQNEPAQERHEQLMKLLKHQERGHRSYQRQRR